MTGLGLCAAGVLAAVAARVGQRRRWLVLAVAVLLLGVGVVLDAAAVEVPEAVADLPPRLTFLGLVGDDAVARVLLLGALLWCGPAADLVVRRVLDATGLPAPEEADAAGLTSGRWIGRLERWILVACVAAGQPALAVVPIGGKALFRYAEVVADARAGLRRLERPGETATEAPRRDALVDYVIVGSLASWTQAVVLGLVAAGGAVTGH